MLLVKAGIEMMIDTLNNILGQRTDKELAISTKTTICEELEVHGVYDLYLFNYGHDKDYGTVHIEVDDTMKADEIDALEHRLQRKIYEKCRIALTGIGIYAVNTKVDIANDIRDAVYE